jgi:hypothetical protein
MNESLCNMIVGFMSYTLLSVITATRPLRFMKLEYVKVIIFPVHPKEETEMLKLN